MAMSQSDRFAAGADALLSASSNALAQRSQLANYAIQNAAKYMQQNKSDEAIKEFKKALAFDPENTNALTYMGKLYLAQNKTSEAINTFKTLVRSQPLSVTAKVNLGNAYLQAKQYTESEKQFKEAARLDPLNPLADYTLGLQYLNTDRLNEAKAQFLKVQKVSPKDGNVYYSLGATLNKEGNFEEAAKNLEKALTYKKDFPAANYELGMAYNKLGRTEDAQKQLSILKNSDYALYEDLKFTLEKPRLMSMDTSKSGGFLEVLGPNTPLWMLDPTLLTDPNTSKSFSITFQFSNQMDLTSVINPQNWSISRANDTAGGYYNNTMPVNPSLEAKIPKNPLTVTYNATTYQATINFSLAQNAEGTAVLDPSHLVFKFSGKDSAGRQMDTSADQIDGYSIVPF